MDLVSLPSEIWLYIYRQAAGHASPLMAARSGRMSHIRFGDPLPNPQDFARDVRSFVLVCRLWNRLANELLYENIQIPADARFAALYAALEKPDLASFVRTIRLSTSRFDYNSAILVLCTRVQVVYQPDVMPSLRSKDSVREPVLPSFQFLRHVYWTESFLTSPLLRLLIRAAPDLEHLFLTPSYAHKPSPKDQLGFPPMTRLRTLACPDFANRIVPYIFKLDLKHLVRLICAPSHLILPEFPTLPALQTLELFGTRQSIRFPIIFTRCPRLRELFYDILNLAVAAEPPRSPRDSLDQLRLSYILNVYSDWGLLDENLGLLLAPEFPRFKRVVLDGHWRYIVEDPRFTHFREGFRARGSQLEFPEGFVL